MTAKRKNVFTYLDLVRERRPMYAHSLRDLESQIHGYYVALQNAGITESVPSMDHHFLIWVWYRMGWSASQGWARSIAEHSNATTVDEQFAIFFELVNEYRRLKPTTLCFVRLKARHVPTGKRVVIGFGGRMDKPAKVEVIRYKPAPLHCLRFHYPDRLEDGWFLMKPDGSYQTTLSDAKRWVQDELQVAPDDWERRA
jgi:hypothetical protein